MIAPRKPGETPAKKSPPAAPPSTANPAAKPSRFVFYFSILVVLMAGGAFLFKLVEFTLTFTKLASSTPEALNADPTLRFAIQPVITYLIVAAGFACLFFWAYLTGQFRNIEGPKFRMLEMQDEIDANRNRVG